MGSVSLATIGITLFGLGNLWWRLRIGQAPDYAGEMLPGLIITGIGVGLTLPSLASAASSSLPPARFATGAAVFTMVRQVGFVLGVSILVAVLGHPSPANALAAFDRGRVFGIVASALGAAAALFIGRRAPRRGRIQRRVRRATRRRRGAPMSGALAGDSVGLVEGAR